MVYNLTMLQELLDRVDIEGPKPQEESINKVMTKTELVGCKEHHSAYLGEIISTGNQKLSWSNI